MKIRLRMAVFGLVACLLTQPAVAGQLEDADAAYNRGDYATALTLMRPLAGQGDGRAQFALWALYSSGHGVPQDDAEALKWLQLAADQGHADGQYLLAIMYESGDGVLQDYVQAYKWFYLAKTPKGLARVATHMTPSQIAEAKRLAHKWKPKH